jgi:hypothetical protein
MVSTWTTNNAIEKIADGEKTDTWGQITNRNFDIIDRATNGVGTIDLSSSGAAHTLYTTDGTAGDTLTDGMYRVLYLSGATENCTITISPNDASKFYLVDNESGYDVTFQQGDGTGGTITILNNETAILYSDGAGTGAKVASIIDDTTLGFLGITATAAELNYNDITTLGTSEASKTVTADANGDVKFANAIVETVYDLTGSSLDPNNGTIQEKTLTANVTFTDNLSDGESMTLILTAGEDYNVIFPSPITWISVSGNFAPTLSAEDTFVFFKASSTLYGVWVGSSE